MRPFKVARSALNRDAGVVVAHDFVSEYPGGVAYPANQLNMGTVTLAEQLRALELGRELGVYKVWFHNYPHRMGVEPCRDCPNPIVDWGAGPYATNPICHACRALSEIGRSYDSESPEDRSIRGQHLEAIALRFMSAAKNLLD